MDVEYFGISWNDQIALSPLSINMMDYVDWFLNVELALYSQDNPTWYWDTIFIYCSVPDIFSATYIIYVHTWPEYGQFL